MRSQFVNHFAFMALINDENGWMYVFVSVSLAFSLFRAIL